MLQAVIAGLSILLFITTLVSAIRQRRADRAGPANLRWARPVLGLAGTLLIAFLIGLAVVFAPGIEKLIFKVPKTLYVALIFPLLAIPPGAAALYFTVLIWKSRAWRPWARLHYTLGSIAVVAFLLVLHYWNLVGYHFG